MSNGIFHRDGTVERETQRGSFRGPLCFAVTEQAWANYQGTVANCRQTVLTVFREVEDNLSTLRVISQELHQQDAAVNSSQRYRSLATDRYKLGIDSYLNIITAQTILLGNQRTAVNLRLQQMIASVQLIKALGGGWDSSETASPNGVSHPGPCRSRSR